MATNTTFRPTVSPLEAVKNRLNRYRTEGLKKGTYLADLAEELVWFTVPATKASYLICAADTPPSSAEVDSAAERPPPAELVMILKISENNWFFRADAHWDPKKKNTLPFEKTKLTFMGEAPPYADLADDYKHASAMLDNLMAQVLNEDGLNEGGFTEKGLRIRHALFGRQDEATPEDVDDAIFKINDWEVVTPAAKRALTEIAESHYILTPPVYDFPGQLIRPLSGPTV